MRKSLHIGLFGFGCVGQGLYEVLGKTPGLGAAIRKVCIRHKEKPRRPAPFPFTVDRNELLDDREINVIIELTDDAEAAFDIVSRAIKTGKMVISANKKMIAEHLPELLELQREYGTPFLYEAACCASIPVIRNLEEYYDNDLLQSISGVINGSTNYILDKMRRDGLSFEQALAGAQAAGYAESDPSLDIEGLDARNKLVILLLHGFGMLVHPRELLTIGINKISKLEFLFAREKGYKIKLVAQAFKKGEEVAAFVMPAFVTNEDKLFHVHDVFNGVNIGSSFSDSQFFEGKGAGAHATASAVLSDLSALSYNYRYEYKKLLAGTGPGLASDVNLKVLWSYSQAFEHLKLWFDGVEEVHDFKDGSYLIGCISLAGIHKILTAQPGCSFVLMEILGEKQPRPLFDLEAAGNHLAVQTSEY